jgi:hypothetical protein
VDTAAGAALGEQFSFSVKSPVTLERGQSAMVPLVEGPVSMRKVLVLSGAKAASGSANPAVAVEVTNNTGMKLPAGPVTVYDGGAYAGDALVDFLPEHAKRLLSYGDDLSVRATATAGDAREVSSVKVSRGVLTINRRLVYERTYRIQSDGSESKTLIIEHPITAGTELAAPAQYAERTTRAYRFELPLPANRETVFVVKESRALAETVALGTLRFDALVSYTTNGDISAPVKAALQRAVALKVAADQADADLKEVQSRRAAQVTEQDRIRRNLEAAGNATPQGQQYLARLTALDAAIDALTTQADVAAAAAKDALDAYGAYLAGLEV